MAQAFGIADLFQKDKLQLIQAIEMRQGAMASPPPVEIPKAQYDARLMTLPPSTMTDRAEIEEILRPYVARGLHLSFDEERWYMKHAKKTDEGTMRMPLRTVLHCAGKVMQ